MNELFRDHFEKIAKERHGVFLRARPLNSKILGPIAAHTFIEVREKGSDKATVIEGIHCKKKKKLRIDIKEQEELHPLTTSKSIRIRPNEKMDRSDWVQKVLDTSRRLKKTWSHKKDYALFGPTFDSEAANCNDFITEVLSKSGIKPSITEKKLDKIKGRFRSAHGLDLDKLRMAS